MSKIMLEKKCRNEERAFDDNEQTLEVNGRSANSDRGNSQYDGSPIDYKSKYMELAKSLDEFYSEFKPYVMNEVL